MTIKANETLSCAVCGNCHIPYIVPVTYQLREGAPMVKGFAYQCCKCAGLWRPANSIGGHLRKVARNAMC